MKHVQQQTSTSCSIATAAMVSRTSFEEAKEWAPDGEHITFGHLQNFLSAKGYACYPEPTMGIRLNRTYIASVPSLNMYATLHSIVIVTGPNWGTPIEVFDPNLGREGVWIWTSDALMTSKSFASLIVIEKN